MVVDTDQLRPILRTINHLLVQPLAGNAGQLDTLALHEGWLESSQENTMDESYQACEAVLECAISTSYYLRRVSWKFFADICPVPLGYSRWN